MNDFGKIIKEIRKNNNLTQKELADKLLVLRKINYIYFKTNKIKVREAIILN